MNQISNETRKEAYIQRPITRQQTILEVLKTRPMTAHQIAECLGFTDMNCVRPRLTELERKGKVEVIGKRIEWTGRSSAVYKIKED